MGQIGRCIDKAVQNDIMIFPEFVAGDEGKTGKAGNRVGLSTLKTWVTMKLIGVIVAFSVSRWFRSLHKGLQFIKEDVVEHGVRAIAIAENVDTNDKQWNDVLTLNLFLAQKQVSALPEFVRMGQKSHVESGFLVGACPLGYKPAPVPEAGTTKKGRPKTRAEVVPEVAEIINRAYERIAGGTTISEACRLYNQDAAGLPESLRQYAVDPRSTTGTMRPEAFRKMLSRERYTGTWRYGVLRNQWMDGKNATVQVQSPEHEVVTYVNEALRIVPDELFHQVQRTLSEGTQGRHGPRTGQESSLATSLINIYHCSECGHVFHYYSMKYMHCPESTKGSCGNGGTVNREDALVAVVSVLRERMLGNGELVTEIVRQSREFDVSMNSDTLTGRIDGLEKSIRRQNTIMSQIEQSCDDEGMVEGDKARHKAAKSEKSRLQAELAVLKAQVADTREPISENEALGILAEFDSLLADAVSGELGGDGKQRASALIRALVGGSVSVSFTRLQGKRSFGVGTFTPSIGLALAKRVRASHSMTLNLPTVSVEFRKLPRYARIADEVHRLHVEEGLSLAEIGRRLNIESGNIWGALAYWYTSRGLEAPIAHMFYNM